MKRNLLIPFGVLGITAASAWGGAATETSFESRLRAMSDFLGSAPTLRLETEEVHQWFGDGQWKTLEARYDLLAWRPDALRIEADGTGPIEIDHTLVYDGRTLTLESHHDKVFARASVPQTIDEMLDEVAWRFDLPIPASDFLYLSPFDAMMVAESRSRYLGTEEVGDRRCDRFAVTQPDVDWEIWIESGPDPLPCRIDIVHKDTPGPATSQIVFRSVEIAADVEEGWFDGTPPEGYLEVPLLENSPPGDAVSEDGEGTP